MLHSINSFSSCVDTTHEVCNVNLRFVIRCRNLAIKSLWDELVAYPKPGLVSLIDSGSHKDMNASTFFKSILSLRKYFYQAAYIGTVGKSFNELRLAAINAEKRMLMVTGGVNTHRGAIFILGILVASAAYRHANDGINISLGELALKLWGKDLVRHKQLANSNGANVKRLFNFGGAIDEVLSGYSSIYKIALPVYKSVLKATNNAHLAHIQTFFTLMAYVADTNILYRGGLEGLNISQKLAIDFLRQGGVYSANWEDRALEIHSKLVNLNLSPGGCADLLSACIFVHHNEFV